jgi:CHAD domain-containing protein
MKAQEQDELRTSTASRALKRSLQRALRNHRRAGRKLKATPVHDLRVSLRRCRSLAEGLSAIDPDPIWRSLRKASKRQQSALSDLRDLQVLESWLKPLRLTTGPVGEALAARLKRGQRRAKKKASRSLDSFPRGRWKRWLRRLPAHAELIPANQRRVAQLVLEQLTRVIELHNRWVGEKEKAEPNPEVWHDLRVTVKRFRYMVESFLPEKSEAWGEELGHAQDLLGEGHDLDVLRALIVKLSGKKSLRKAEAAVAKALRRVDAAAQKRRDEYAALVSAAADGRERATAAGEAEAVPNTAEAGAVGKSESEPLWVRWRAELLPMAKVSGRGGEESARSAARRASRAKAPASRYRGRPRRISSAT